MNDKLGYLKRRLPPDSLKLNWRTSLVGAMVLLTAIGYVRQLGGPAAYVAVFLFVVVWADIWGYRRSMRLLPSQTFQVLMRGAFVVSILSALGAYFCLISRICPLCSKSSETIFTLRSAGPVTLVAAYVSCVLLLIVGEVRDPCHKTQSSRYFVIAAYAGFALAFAALTSVLLHALATSR